MKSTIKITQFGSYTFENGMTAEANFTDLISSWSTVIDADGQFDNQLNSRGKQSVGTISATFMLVGENPTIMRKKRDALAALVGKGPQPLWYITEDIEQSPRYCRARLRSLDMSEQAEDVDTIQTVKISWNVSLPRWFSRPHVNYLGYSDFSGSTAIVDQETYYLNYNAQIEIGQFISMPRVLDAMVRDGSEIEVCNLGNAPAIVVLKIRGSRQWDVSEGLTIGDPGVYADSYGSLTLKKPTVTRINSIGAIIDQFMWSNTLTVNEVLEVNSKLSSVTLYGYPNFESSGYSSFIAQENEGFIYLDPGLNTIRINGTFSDGFGFMSIDWDDAWF